VRSSRVAAVLGVIQVIGVGLLGPASASPVVASTLTNPVAAVRPAADMMMPMPDPPDCSRYSQPRKFLEVQAWWSGKNTPNGRAHLHAGTCFPLGERVRGRRLRFDIRVIMHNNPAHLFSLSMGIFGGDDKYRKLDRRCTGTCTWWFTMYVNTRSTLDGWHEFRLKPRVRFANGKRMMTSTGWPAFIDNGRRIGDNNRRTIGPLIGRGWYEGQGYQNPQLQHAREALRGPKTGLWTPEVKLDNGAGGYEPTKVFAYVDADFHAGDPGWVVLSRDRPYRGNLSIDTHQLANGWHRLMLRVTARHFRNENTGIEVIYFRVAN